VPQLQKDNSNFEAKLRQRRAALRLLGAPPVIMECYGGWGRLGQQLYDQVQDGITFEKDPNKVAALAQLRPTWRVYECDTVYAIENGAGADMPINFLDVDPYGDPWPTIKAFFVSHRQRSDRIVVAVHDGFRTFALRGRAWASETLAPLVARYGNGRIGTEYLNMAHILMNEHAALAGYTVTYFHGFYTGHNQQTTLYTALLTRGGSSHVAQNAAVSDRGGGS
jgi:hypothetical protein